MYISRAVAPGDNHEDMSPHEVVCDSCVGGTYLDDALRALAPRLYRASVRLDGHWEKQARAMCLARSFMAHAASPVVQITHLGTRLS